MEKTRKDILVADTSGLVSLVISQDHNHAAAIEAAEQMRTQQGEILIPTAVFYEFLNVLGKKVSHTVAVGAVSALTPPFILLSTPPQQTHEQALERFTSLPPAVSFTDCLVMATADEYQTREIFGFDKQFADAGYVRLTPSTEWKEAV